MEDLRYLIYPLVEAIFHLDLQDIQKALTKVKDNSEPRLYFAKANSFNNIPR